MSSPLTVIGLPPREEGSQSSPESQQVRGGGDVVVGGQEVYTLQKPPHNEVGLTFRRVFEAHEHNPTYRPTMEDEVLVYGTFADNPYLAAFAVLDGHGGREAVELVNNELPHILAHQIPHHPTLETALFHTFDHMQARCHQLKEHIRYSGTTAALAMVAINHKRQRVVVSANVGDSRTLLSYHTPEGRLVVLRLSRDHKPTDPKEEQRIQESQGFVAQERLNGILACSRALGDIPLTPALSHVPHVTTHAVPHAALDPTLIVACDGLFDVATDETVAEVAHQALEQGRDPATILVQYAIDHGTTDNVSVLVVRL